jgi:hypothetical protein
MSMLVRLTQKLAERIDGVDLSGHSAGQIIELPVHQAALLIAEGWAAPARRELSRARSRRPDAHASGTPAHNERDKQASSRRR